MKCLNCDFDNPEGMRFCGYCGTLINNICPNCGYSNPIQAKFCGKCNIPFSPLQISDALTRIQKYIPSYLAEKIRQSKGNMVGERKNVTVVFADISGFTSMAETHDPEEVSAIINTCHTMLGKIVYKYEGVVDKIIGDGLMALFGIPSRENDPERAILASMEMQQGMKELSKKLQEKIGISLGLKIGINTGIVVIGDIGTNLRLDYTVIGDVVNTASRVEGEAESGEILITQQTYQRTSHCFDFQELELIQVRGKKQPIQVHKVVRIKEKPLRERGIKGLYSPLIGRSEEYAVCKQYIDQLIAGKGGTLLITGEAGLGKSRLVDELKAYAQSQNITWLEGRCVSHLRSINYRVFTDAIKNYFEIKNSDDETEIENKINKKQLIEGFGSNIISNIRLLLSPKLGDERIAFDFMESDKKLMISNAVKDMLAVDSQHKPLVLAIDDIHWADELSIELLLFLIRNLSQYRIVFVCIYRPPIADEKDTHHIQKLENDLSYVRSTASIDYTKIVLKSLSSDNSYKLLESLLAVEGLPSEMKRLILDKASGNPLYLEEVIRSLIDSKAIEYRDGRWMAVKEVKDIKIPGTVQDVIMARIDRLKEETKSIFQCASVIGNSFEYGILSYLMAGNITSINPQTPEVSEDNLLDDVSKMMSEIEDSISVLQNNNYALDQHLDELEKMGFIYRLEGTEHYFKFKHIMIQDVVYSTVLIKRRKKLHEMIGKYIEKANFHHLEDSYELLAYHYNNSNNTKLAISYLVKAGDKNRKSISGSAENAIGYFSSALDVLEKSSLDSDDRVINEQNIYGGIGEAFKDLGEYEKSLTNFETMLHATELTKDFRGRSEAYRQIANIKAQIGDWESALGTYEKSLSIVRDLGDLPRIGFVYNGIGYGYFERGEYKQAEKYFNDALRIGKQCDDHRLIGDASNGLGTIASIRYEFDNAIQNYNSSLQSYKEIGESHYEAQTYQNIGITHFKKNELDIADRYYEESLRISEKCGYIRLTVYTYLNRAEIYLCKSELDRSIDFCRKAFQILHTLDDKWALAEVHKIYGMIYKHQKDFQSAKKAFRKSLDVSIECSYLQNIAEVNCEMGLICKEEMVLPEALTHFDESKRIFEELKIIGDVDKINGYINEIKMF
jgi:class 3 adenylate cyclase/tetratricopeptide (TPR) repeat protein